MSTSTRSLRTKQTGVQGSPVKVPSKTAPRKSATGGPSSSKTVPVLAPSKTAPIVKHKLAVVYCTCKGGDDGSPMVECAECQKWYHFKCVKLGVEEAEELSVYVCPTCTIKTGRRSVLEWEGPDAIEERTVTTPSLPTPTPTLAQALVATLKPKKEKEAVVEAEQDPEPPKIFSDPDSGDEYVVGRPKPRTLRFGKRAVRRLNLSSDSEDEAPVARPRRTSTTKLSLKRKPATSTAPPSKRKKSEVSEEGAWSDPARKYCLEKMQSMAMQIFLHYPHINGVQRKTEELTDEEKDAVRENAKTFGEELEKSVHEIYSDLNGSVGGKYKEEFRMLTFNLSQNDRTTLHTRIASSHLTADALARMSSTELANEEMQLSIMETQKAALAHSILTKSDTPRKKITHKGLEDIETENNNVPAPAPSSMEEMEEKRERERLSRSRIPSLPSLQRSGSISIPPESPVAPHTAAWGAPPPLPYHPADMASDFAMAEPELNLADLINIDEDDAQDGAFHVSSSAIPPASPVSVPTAEPTGISPFAVASPETAPKHVQAEPQMSARRPSFDLSSLWNGPKAQEPSSPEQAEEDLPAPRSPSPPPKDTFMDTEAVETAADDDDFDMFLEQDVPTVDPHTVFERLPHVWSGMINMPLDSSIPQETRVFARQIGGKPISYDSAVWKTLFPAEAIRVDGRVPVANSSKFLLQSRLSSVKELVAVAFAPGDEPSAAGFKYLSEFLISKGRHGLVFPWGSRPKEHHPGKEMYIIPLLSTEPLPDYMDMLDNLELPKTRTADYLVGIWVLTKGKLAPPLASETKQPVPVPIPTPAPEPKTSTTTQMSDAALAAEVAALSPEQIQAMLRTLTGVGLAPSPAPAPVVAPTPLPVAVPPPTAMAPVPPGGLPVPLGVPTGLHGNGRGTQPLRFPPALDGVPTGYGSPMQGGPPPPGPPRQFQPGPHARTPPRFPGATPPQFTGATPPQFAGATPPPFLSGPPPPNFRPQFHGGTPPQFPPSHQPPGFQPGPHYRPPYEPGPPVDQWGPPNNGTPPFNGEPSYNNGYGRPPPHQQYPPMYNGPPQDQWSGRGQDQRGGGHDHRGRGGRGRGGGGDRQQGSMEPGQGWSRRDRGPSGPPLPPQQWGQQQQQRW